MDEDDALKELEALSGGGGEKEMHHSSSSDDVEAAESNNSETEEQEGTNDESLAPRFNQQKLFDLRLKLNEARKRTHAAVRTEAQEKKEEAISQTQRFKMMRQQKKQKAVEETKKKGADPNRWVLDVTAEAAEKSQKKKKTVDGFGWSAFDDNTQHLQYKKKTKHFDQAGEKTRKLAEYETLKEKLGDKVYLTADSLEHGTAREADIPEANKNRLVAEMEKGRAKAFSRRRGQKDGQYVDYINERNKRFNEKLSRAFDPFTVEIRQNLERGTAL